MPVGTPVEPPTVVVTPPTVVVDASVAVAIAPDAGAPVAANTQRDASVAVAPVPAYDAGTTTAAATPDAGSTAGATTPPASTNTELPRRPSREVQDQTQAAIEQRVASCEGHLGHHAYIRVVYDGPTGQPSAVEFTGHTLDGNPLAACLESAVRAVPVPAFRDAHWEAHYTMMIR